VTHPTTVPIWESLLKAGIVQDPPPQSRELDTPWYVKVLLALSGWLAALCLFAFFGMLLKSLLFNSAISFIIGSVLIGAAISVLRLHKKEFYEHLAIATSLTGQALVVFAMTNYLKGSSETVWLLIALLEIALLFVIPNFIHRVFSAYFATVALTFLMLSIGVSFIFSITLVFFTCWLWLNEFRYPQHMKMIQAAGYALLLAINQLNTLALTTYISFSSKLHQVHPEAWVQPWMSEFPIAIPMLYVVWQQLKRNGHRITELFSIMILAATVMINVISMEVGGLNEGILILLLGYAGSNRVILGLGIITLLVNLSSYYYLLETTLLVKSQILFFTGVLLLAARWLLLRFISDAKEPKNAR